MNVKRPVDIIDWRGERAKKIVKEFNNWNYTFTLTSFKEYELGPFEVIRLVNIFATSNNIKQSLNGFVNLLQKRDLSHELPGWRQGERK